MALDIQSTRVTWAAVLTIVSLAFSSGTGWFVIFDNKEVNTKQWDRLNYLESKSEKHDTQLIFYAKLSASSEESNRQLSSAITELTIATKVASEQARQDGLRREKDSRVMNSLSDDMTNIKIKVGRIEEKLSK